MTNFTKTEENYIEHEVQLRLHDHRFTHIDDSIKDLRDSIRHLDNKLTWGVGIFISLSIIGYLIPIALQFIKIS